MVQKAGNEGSGIDMRMLRREAEDDELFEHVIDKFGRDAEQLLAAAQARFDRVSKVDPGVDSHAMVKAELDDWYTRVNEEVQDDEAYEEYSEIMRMRGLKALTRVQFLKKKRGESPRDRLDFLIDKGILDRDTGTLITFSLWDKHRQRWIIYEFTPDLLLVLKKKGERKSYTPDRIINFFNVK